jgi:hypothetical protein
MRPSDAGRRGISAVAALVVALSFGACQHKKTGSESDAGTVHPVDGGDVAPDAGIPEGLTPAAGLSAGAMKLQGSRYSMDVQVGHAHGQEPMRGGGTTLEANAPVKP